VGEVPPAIAITLAMISLAKQDYFKQLTSLLSRATVRFSCSRIDESYVDHVDHPQYTTEEMKANRQVV
jgi:hypothetical protein